MKRCTLYVVFDLLAGFALFETLFTLVSTVRRDHPSLCIVSLIAPRNLQSTYLEKEKTDVNHKTGYMLINHIKFLIVHSFLFGISWSFFSSFSKLF